MIAYVAVFNDRSLTANELTGLDRQHHLRFGSARHVSRRETIGLKPCELILVTAPVDASRVAERSLPCCSGRRLEMAQSRMRDRSVQASVRSAARLRRDCDDCRMSTPCIRRQCSQATLSRE